MDRDQELWTLVILLQSSLQKLQSRVDVLLAGKTGAGPLGLSLGPPPDVSALGAVGAAKTAARADHTHGHGDQAGGELHAVASSTVAGFMSAADKNKLDGVAVAATSTPLSTLAPLKIAVASVVGTALEAARSDHTHGHGDLAGGTLHAVATPLEAGFMSAADKNKLDGVAVAATSTPLSTVAPPKVAVASLVGTALEAARGDHTHGHGDQAGGTLHVVVTPTVAGFMSAADKNKLDGVANGATSTPLAGVAPPKIAAASVVGTAAEAARSDHTHGHGDQAGGTLHVVATPTVAGFMSAADKSKLDGLSPSAGAGHGLRLRVDSTAMLLPSSYFGCDGNPAMVATQIVPEVCCVAGTANDWTLESVNPTSANTDVTILRAPTGGGPPVVTAVVLHVPTGKQAAISNVPLTVSRGDRITASCSAKWNSGGLTLRGRISV